MQRVFFSVIVLFIFLISCKNKKANLNEYEFEGLKSNYSTSLPLEGIKPVVERTKRAVNYFNEIISDQKINVSITILSKIDWEDYTHITPYGMPHVLNKSNLVMAYENNDFWKSAIPKTGVIPDSSINKFNTIYADENGEVNMKTFFDLISIHELGHAIAMQTNIVIEKHWLNEFLMNYFLHCYIATNEPETLDRLTFSPSMNLKILSGGKFKTLEEFDENYAMDPLNYVWYQAKYHQIAEEIYNKIGDKGLIKMFRKLKNNTSLKTNEDYIDFIDKEISPEMASSFRNF